MADPKNIKPDARRLIDQLPEGATWDDLAYEVYVRQALPGSPMLRPAAPSAKTKRIRARIRRAS